jgi:hypothetical protein
MFSPDARVTTMRFADRYVCHVIDDALLDPELTRALDLVLCNAYEI